MSTRQWEAPESLQAYLSTDLNSLGNTSFSASGAEINNESDKKMFIGFELVLAAQGVARSTGAAVEVWKEEAIDATPTYGDRAVAEIITNCVATIQLDAATTARRVNIDNIPLSPFKQKFYVRNGTGQAFAASGNTLKYRRYNEAIV